MNRYAVVAALALLVPACGVSPTRGDPMSRSVRVVYIEASIGRRWQLEEFGRRVGDERFQVRHLAEYAFDKSARVAEALNDSAGRPDFVVLQECSVYFPGPLEEYQRLYAGWIARLRAAGVTPVVATSIPPARRRSVLEQAGEFVKSRLLGRPRRYEQIVAFNSGLRALARDEGLPLLDLEAALQAAPGDAHLAPRFDSGDGIHVNAAAYAVMDRALVDLLRRCEERSTVGAPPGTRS